MQTWIARAGDPDVPMAERLKNGAPAVITHQPENVGVFPTSVSPPSEEFALSFWDGSEVNYVSMEESQYSVEVLSKLVESGYIVQCDSIEEAKELLSGATPVISKGALISKE